MNPANLLFTSNMNIPSCSTVYGGGNLNSLDSPDSDDEQDEEINQLKSDGQNNGNNYCALLLRGCKNYEPLIVLKCGDSKVVFDKITIEHIKIKIITTTAECKIKHGNR